MPPLVQHVLAAGDEQQQQQVAGEHVAEESQRERDRPGEEVGDQLEDEDAPARSNRAGRAGTSDLQ